MNQTPLEITVREGGFFTGDLKVLKMVSDIRPYVEDQGIGYYEFWGSSGVDKQLTAVTEDEGLTVRLTAEGSWEDPPVWEDLVGEMLDWADVPSQIDYSDSDDGDVDEETGRFHYTHRGTGVEATFYCKHTIKVESPTAVLVHICYE